MDTAINNWQLSPADANTTKVHMHLVVKTKGLIGVIMGPMIKMQLGKQIASIPTDLKHYVETGNPSPHKSKELEKLGKIAA
ncbi:MAG: hypothetical protein AAF696_24305 [Bacteroidota bacterium]